MNKYRLLIIITFLASACPAFSADDFSQFSSIEEIKWGGLSKAVTIEETNTFVKKQGKPNENTIWGQLEKSTNERDYACVKSFGHTGFCKCLGENLPAYLSFDGYVALVTGKNANKYLEGMKADEIYKFFKKVIEVRDSCVTKSTQR